MKSSQKAAHTSIRLHTHAHTLWLLTHTRKKPTITSIQTKQLQTVKGKDTKDGKIVSADYQRED